MVYRGKPSAGCDNCRKAKKRCTLEQPACARCIKLKKPCTGYRDINALQIEDESQAVIQKALRKNQDTGSKPSAEQSLDWAGLLTSATNGSSDGTIDLPMRGLNASDSQQLFYELTPTQRVFGGSLALVSGGTGLLTPRADDLAETNFFNSFTSESVWEHMRAFAQSPRIDPCLEFAIRACGMAALDNVEKVVMGKEYARSMYARSLSLLNEALRDPERCRNDETLIAVAMLGYFENLTCDSPESIVSWKAHINGATSLLKMRGRDQLRTPLGRLLFRETRAQILINCLWEDTAPPPMLWEWEDELQKLTLPPANVVFHADKLTRLIYNFARCRNLLAQNQIAMLDAYRELIEMEQEMIRWSEEAILMDDVWRFSEMEVPDSSHVWNGVVYDYMSQIGATLWNTWRCIRIMLTRNLEQFSARMNKSSTEHEHRVRQLRKVRRQMTDEICATMPCQLGHASPAFNSNCVLVTAHGSVWPLFFAGMCALERIGLKTWPDDGIGTPNGLNTSAVAAQVAWIIGRMDYIGDKIGLRWAKGIAATLRGDFRIHGSLSDDDLPRQQSASIAELDA